GAMPFAASPRRRRRCWHPRRWIGDDGSRILAGSLRTLLQLGEQLLVVVASPQGFEVVVLLHVLDILVSLGDGLLQQRDGTVGAVCFQQRAGGFILTICREGEDATGVVQRVGALLFRQFISFLNCRVYLSSPHAAGGTDHPQLRPHRFR